ncbi:MAG: type I DNA topoisomerase [Christensenellaceae bacterium]|jgi:DNA topoisomerase-1|nr:type I DNA topoisomerase [Christensenellaceae bacterium]
MKLVIIEGIGKKDTIKKYLGAGFEVMATGGHFRDLQKHALSVDVEDNYKPKYVIIKESAETVKKIQDKAERAEDVLIATDPDREGEAIAWHLTHILHIKPEEAHRIAFHEITKNAVQKALTEPRPIDMRLVDAQQARRVLDRLVGYKLSPLLSKKIKPKLSAGRVQSVTLKLVVLREREIQNFKPEEFWDFNVWLEKSREEFMASLITGLDGKKIKLKNKAEVDKVFGDIQGAKYIVSNVKKSITKQHAPAPYTTSSMQQDALNKAGMSLAKTTSTAQKLYQGVNLGERGQTALVTYIRTDSVRVSPEAQATARKFITETFGADFVPETPNFYKTKKQAQDAHEAIRPTHIEITPSELEKMIVPDKDTKDILKLYRLIYNRFLASQMSEATFNSVSVDINANGYGFRVTGRTPIFAGWLAVYGVKATDEEEDNKKKNDDEEDEGAKAGNLPALEIGDECKFIKFDIAQKFTKPPARYTEATLVKAMEEKGIGRPATYNATIQTISARFYIEKEGKAIKPTELGFTVVDWLEKYFPNIMDIGFTAEMEDKLDDICDPEISLEWTRVIDDFYKGFDKELVVALDGEEMRIATEITEIPCPNCGKPMAVRQGKYGKFLGCTGFPNCRTLMPMPEAIICNCPKCKTGQVSKRKSKNGRFFYGCSNYPNCAFVAWDEPTGELCPICNAALVMKNKKTGIVNCNNHECAFNKK